MAFFSHVALWALPIAALSGGAGLCALLHGWPAGLLYFAIAMLLPGLATGRRGMPRVLLSRLAAALIGAGYAGLGVLVALLFDGGAWNAPDDALVGRAWSAMVAGGAAMMLWDALSTRWKAFARRMLAATRPAGNASAGVLDAAQVALRIVATSALGLLIAAVAMLAFILHP